MNDMITIHKDKILLIQDFVLNKSPEIQSYYELDIDPRKTSIRITSRKLLITDPNYLADIFNGDGQKEKYLKRHGILLMDFGGDVSGPVFRTVDGGLKIYLLFDRVDSHGNPVFREEEKTELQKYELDSSNLGCDSGSYIFLDYSFLFRLLFSKELAENARSQNDLFIVDMPNGVYNVGYEQWETDENDPYEYMRRNLVVWPEKKQ